MAAGRLFCIDRCAGAEEAANAARTQRYTCLLYAQRISLLCALLPRLASGSGSTATLQRIPLLCAFLPRLASACASGSTATL